jgi:hypothetical protein
MVARVSALVGAAFSQSTIEQPLGAVVNTRK